MVTTAGLLGAYCAIAFMVFVVLGGFCSMESPSDSIAWATALTASVFWIVVIPASFLIWFVTGVIQYSVSRSKLSAKRPKAGITRSRKM